jgi:5-methyltetrahydrofolate--homocysteine methyltransferase
MLVFDISPKIYAIDGGLFMIDLLGSLAQGVEKGDDKQVVELVGKALQGGTAAREILEEGLVPGIQALGQRFKEGMAYLPEILVSCRAMSRGVELLKPHLGGADVGNKGTVVVGTVEGDMHDIGKNLVKIMLESNGFRVEDLGADVVPETFVNAVRDSKADVVALSALLTMTMVEMPNVIGALKEAGLRGKVKVLIGGAPITRQFADEIGAEGFAEDCASAVDEVVRLMAL